MPAGYTNIYIEAGASFSVTLQLTDSTSTPLDLTGYTGACKIRRSYFSDYYSYPLTVTITNPATGTITITATAAETLLMKPNRYVYDVELTSGSTVSRVVEGIAEVRPTATSYVGATGATGI